MVRSVDLDEVAMVLLVGSPPAVSSRARRCLGGWEASASLFRTSGCVARGGSKRSAWDF